MGGRGASYWEYYSRGPNIKANMRVKYGIVSILFGLEYVVVLVGASSTSGSGSGGTGDGNDDNNNTTTTAFSSTSSTILIDDPHHNRHQAGGGGLYWRDLGVSLVNCPWTTAQMLDKYDSDATSTIDDGRKQQWRCMDDSTWLLHPSSGFVENGSLCGILGPR